MGSSEVMEMERIERSRGSGDGVETLLLQTPRPPSPRHPVTPSPRHPVTPSPRHPVTPSPDLYHSFLEFILDTI